MHLREREPNAIRRLPDRQRGVRRLVAPLALALAALLTSGQAAGRPAGPPAQSPVPALPDTGGFDQLLYYLARPPGNEQRMFVVSDVNLALRTGAHGLLPLDGKGVKGDPNMLAAPAMNATLSELPASQSLVNRFAPSSSGILDVRVRDLGPLLERGPVMRFQRALFGGGTAGRLAADVVGGAAAVALIHGLGTTQAALLGISPALTTSFGEGRVSTNFVLRSGKKFANAHAENVTRVRLLHFDAPLLSALSKDLFLEGGLVYNHNQPDEARLPYAWSRVRFAGSRLEAAFGGHIAGGTDQPAWGDADGTLNADPFRLRLSLSRQANTGISQITTALMNRGETHTAGVFFGAHSTAGLSAGVLAMMVF